MACKKPPDNIIDQVFGQPQKSITDTSEAENVSLIIKEWVDPKHVKFKTRYSKRQVISVSILQSLADTYKINTLKRFLKEFRVNKLSEDGESSRELEEILKARIPEIQESNLEKLSKFLE